MKKTIQSFFRPLYKAIFVAVCTLALSSPPVYLAHAPLQATNSSNISKDSGVDEGLYGDDLCFASMGMAMYGYDGRACDPKYAKGVSWDSFPLKVYIAKSHRPHIQPGVVRAITHMEKITGRDLFTIVETQTPDVKIFITYTFETYPNLRALNNNTLASAYHYYDLEDRLNCDLEFIKKYEDDPQTFKDIVMHELGHALGLKHDGIKESIMYPSMGNDQKFTKKDIDLMKGL